MVRTDGERPPRAFLTNCTPAPTTFEFVTDVDARTKIRTQSIRGSFQF